MGKLTLYIAASLDGYIATEDESLDWLDAVEGQGDNGYGAFYDTVDVILMGRRTYDWIIGHGEFPYPGKPCYVFSRTVNKASNDVQFADTEVAEFVRSLKEAESGRIWLVGGGKLAQELLQEKLVDEIILTIAPVLLGKGIPLFLPNVMQQFCLVEMKRYGQFAQLHYQMKTEN